MSWRDSIIIAPVTAYHHVSYDERYSRYKTTIILRITGRAPLSGLQVPRHGDHGDALLAAEEQQRSQDLRPVIVQEKIVPSAFDECRNHNGDLAVRMALLQLECVLQDRTDHEAIR